MKKTKLVSLFAAMTLLVSLTYSCAKEDQSSIPADQKQMNLKMAPADCASVCIAPGTGVYYESAAVATGLIGNNTKQIDYTVYNTETDFVVILKYSRNPVQSKSSSTVKVTVNGSDQTQLLLHGKTATLTFPLANGWKGCDVVNFSIVETVYDGALPISVNGTYNLIGICSEGCTENFNTHDNGNGTYTFTYLPAENISGALLEFTFPQGVVISAPEGWNRPGNSATSVVRQITKDLTACEAYSFTFGLTHSAKGKGQGPLWTDFKVNNVSKN